MKEALLRKRYGIPAALLIVLLLSGTALAWYSVNTISSETTVQESLSTTEKTEFSDTMNPGDANTWTFDIVNSADVTYDIKADLTFDAPNGVSILGFRVVSLDKNGNRIEESNEKDDLLDDGSAEFSIPANGKVTCRIDISAANDATPGDVSVKLALSRG